MNVIFNKKMVFFSAALIAAFAAITSCRTNTFSGKAPVEPPLGANASHSPSGSGTPGGPDGPNGPNGPNSSTSPNPSNSNSPGPGGPSPGPSGSGTPGGPDTNEDITVHHPQICSGAAISFIPINGSPSCPPHHAAFAADDGDSIQLTCCPLPAKDILTNDAPQVRGSTCGANEVATGVSGLSLICSKLNTTRYRMATPIELCYVGSGAAGGENATKCGAPAPTMQAMVSLYGSDACLGFPFGSLVMSWKGKHCREMQGAQILFNNTGAPVKMFP